jgi:hypothetical protein
MATPPEIDLSLLPWNAPSSSTDVIQGDKIPEELLNQMRKTGLCAVAQKEHGKTKAFKLIAKQFMKMPNVRVFYFDPCQNLRHEFAEIPYVEMNDSTFDISELRVKDVLFDVELMDERDRLLAISQIIMQDFMLKRELKKIHKGFIPYWTLFFVEEAQDVFSNGTMKSRIGKGCKTAIAEGRNFNQGYFINGQRLADIDTSVVGRCKGYLIGALNEDNDIKKIKRVTNETVAAKCQQLQPDCWIYWTGRKGDTRDVEFKGKFQPEGQPYPLIQQTRNISVRKLFIP